VQLLERVLAVHLAEGLRGRGGDALSSLSRIAVAIVPRQRRRPPWRRPRRRPGARRPPGLEPFLARGNGGDLLGRRALPARRPRRSAAARPGRRKCGAGRTCGAQAEDGSVPSRGRRRASRYPRSARGGKSRFDRSGDTLNGAGPDRNAARARLDSQLTSPVTLAPVEGEGWTGIFPASIVRGDRFESPRLRGGSANRWAQGQEDRMIAKLALPTWKRASTGPRPVAARRAVRLPPQLVIGYDSVA
jgi:hypothetical protein